MRPPFRPPSARLRGAVVLAALALGLRGADGPPLVERPLAERSGPRGATMFTVLPPERTGIVTENRYNDPQMWGALYHEFEVGEIATGVAIGDYDGDGRPDVFVVSKTESCRLFRNLGGWKFQDVTAAAHVGDEGAAATVWKQGATWADVNNDGRLDLYVCRFNAPNLLYVNQGDGTFREMAHAYGLDVVDASVVGAFCDYDRDGWLDVLVQTNLRDANAHSNGQRNYLFHNERNGTFRNVTGPAGIAGEGQGHSATWWDYDGDGWPDLYIANDFAAPDRLYHNNRDGTFTNVIDRVVPYLPFSAMGSDLGDIDNDGWPDLIVGEMAARTHEQDQRGMVNTRSQAHEPASGSRESPQYYHNALYLNAGTGRCREAAFLAGIANTDWSWSLRFEDLDNDGWLDLHITTGMHREATNADLLMRQMSAESAMDRMRIMKNSPPLAEKNLAFRNRGDLRFEEVGAAWGLDELGVSFGAAYGDLDGDGDLDVVYGNYQRGCTVLRNDCQTGNRVIVELRGTRSNRCGAGATIRLRSALGQQMRTLVIARGVLSSSEPMAHFGLGDDPVVDQLTVDWPSGERQTFRSLSVNRHYIVTEPAAPVAATPPPAPTPTLFVDASAAAGCALASREEVVDEVAQQPLLPLRLNRRGPALAVADVDGDGREDVVIGGTTLDPLRLLLGGPDGRFHFSTTAGLPGPGPVDDGPVVLVDVNGDGAPDLLVTRGGAALPAGSPEYQPQLFLNDGAGHFRPAPADALPALPLSAGSASTADFDGDGRPDVFIGGRVLPGQYPLAPRSALLANRGGVFADVTDSVAPALREIGMVTSSLWTDLDGDGRPDLVLTLEWGGVRCFHNEGGRRLEDWTERTGFSAAGTGWWNSVATADFNGDGRPDFVVGNLGLNTQYHADPAHPALLFYGDFSDDGAEPQIVEAHYEGEQLVPWRSRRDLGAAIPAVLRRFPRNDVFARAALGEILGEAKLAAAQRFAATELRSGVLLSQPDGRYRFVPLPWIAQIAPLQGLAAGDFNGDGNADIFGVQNSFAPVPAVGRFAGGLGQLLLGDGHGNFTAVPPRESGLEVPGDAKALVACDFDGDGWPDFLVTRNNDTALAFRNRGVAGRGSLRVTVRAPAGATAAASARVVAEFADGTTQALDLAPVSGYYSQSGAAGFIGCPHNAPPQRLRIRWSSGQTTVQDVPAGAATVELKAPGR